MRFASRLTDCPSTNSHLHKFCTWLYLCAFAALREILLSLFTAFLGAATPSLTRAKLN
jgi:hypothetical protein